MSPPDQFQSAASSSPNGQFEASARQVLERVQVGLRAVLQALPAPTKTGADIRRALGLDTRLTTQLARVASAKDPLLVANHVPGPPSMGRFLEAVRAAGVEEPLVDRFSATMDEFETLVQEHAGDRTSFASLVTHLGGHGSSATQLQHRRAAFHAMSHLLGVQLDTYARTCIITENAETRSHDVTQVRSFLGAVRLRPDSPIPLFTSQVLATGVDRLGEAQRPSPVYGEILEGTGIGLVPGCGLEEADSVHVSVDDGLAMAELRGDSLGAKASQDLCFAQRELSLNSGTVGGVLPDIGINQIAMVPARRVVVELFAPPGLLKQGTDSMVYMHRWGRNAASHKDMVRLDVNPSVSKVDLSNDPSDPMVATSHRDAVHAVMEHLQIPHELIGYRAELEFPVVGTIVRLYVRDL